MKFVLKKYLLLILSFGSITAMEKRPQDDALALVGKGKKQKTDLSEICWFDTIPNEIILQIIEHVINDSPRLIVVFQRLAKLVLINKNFRDLVSSNYVRKYIEKRFKSKIAFDEGTLQTAFNSGIDDHIKSIMKIKGMNLSRAEYRQGKNIVTPLIWIAQKGDCEFLKELAINSKENNIFADMYNWDEAGNTALVYAKEKNDSEMIRLLENNKPTDEYGSYWRAYPKSDGFKRSSEVRTGCRCKQYTPLIEAVISNNLKRTKELKRGIDFAFILACQIGNSSIVSCLLEKINDVNSITLHRTADQDEVTPLYIAIKYGHFNVVKLLLDKNAEVTERDFKLACAHGYADIVKLLINYIINKNYNPSTRRTIFNAGLSLAIANNHLDIVKLLMKHDACIDEIAISKHDDVARKKGHKEIVQYLDSVRLESARLASIYKSIKLAQSENKVSEFPATTCKMCDGFIWQSNEAKAPCGHIFHKDCLAWLSNECPECKR